MAFLALPAELRIQIYKYIFADADQRVYRSPRDDDGHPTEVNDTTTQHAPISRFGILQTSTFTRKEVHSEIRAFKPYHFKWEAPRHDIDEYDDRRPLLRFFDEIEVHVHIAADAKFHNKLHPHDLRRARNVIDYIATPEAGQTSLTLWLVTSSDGMSLDKKFAFGHFCLDLHRWPKLRILVSCQKWSDHVEPIFASSSLYQTVTLEDIRRQQLRHNLTQMQKIMEAQIESLDRNERGLQMTLFLGPVKDTGYHHGVCSRIRPACVQPISTFAQIMQDDAPIR